MLRSVASISAWTAHAIAWAAGLWLAFGPVYQGVEATLPGESGSEVTRLSATMVEVNGLYVIPLLLVPVLLTGIALLALRLIDTCQTRRRVLLFGSAVGLLGFCAMGFLSFGVLYLPAALALLLAAVTGSRGRAAN